MLTLHAAAASAAFQLATMPEYPSRHLAPNDVIEAFTSNLQASKHSHAFRWVSEHCRQATGVRRRQSIRSQSVPYYLQFPDYKTLPQYRPLVGCAQYELVHGIQHGRIFFGRVHCWPTQVRYIGDMTIAVAASSPIEYQYVLKQNPDVYPACYEYDPMQAGVAAGPPHNGCWLVESVRRVGGDDDGDGGRDSDDPSGGGVALAPTPTSPPRALATALR